MPWRRREHGVALLPVLAHARGVVLRFLARAFVPPLLVRHLGERRRPQVVAGLELASTHVQSHDVPVRALEHAADLARVVILEQAHADPRPAVKDLGEMQMCIEVVSDPGDLLAAGRRELLQATHLRRRVDPLPLRERQHIPLTGPGAVRLHGELLRADLPHATGALFEAPVRGRVLGLVSAVLGRGRDPIVDEVARDRLARRQ